MTPRRFQCVLAAVAVVAVTACGSGTTRDAHMASQSSDSNKASAPSTATGPTYAEGVIEKKVGEPAGLNCPDDPNKSCDLNFTVTAIQQGAACDAAAGRPGPDQQFLRVDIEAFSSGKTFEFPDSADALLLQHWTVDGADGGRHDVVAYPECGDGAAPISEPVAPGTHARARVVVNAPKPAEKLRISWLELNWEWPISGSD
jgi:hypothetical protein